MTRVREQQVNVTYPTELDDELFSDRGYNEKFQSIVDMQCSPASRQGEVQSSSWLCGWNFTTDLYRVLEHVITNVRDRKRHRGSFPTDMFADSSVTALPTVQDSVTRLYINLPQCFKEVSQVTCDPARSVPDWTTLTVRTNNHPVIAMVSKQLTLQLLSNCYE